MAKKIRVTTMPDTGTILQIAIPTPLRKCFDYLPPENATSITVGSRVRVPFRHKEVVGVIQSISQTSSYPVDKIRRAIEILDSEALITPGIMRLCEWASQYYHYPIGEVLSVALPKRLRQGHLATLPLQKYWSLASEFNAIKLPQNAISQIRCIELLNQYPDGLSENIIKQQGISTQTLKSLQQKGFVDFFEREVLPTRDPKIQQQNDLTLNAEQEFCVNAITQSLSTFNAFLLEGITGSGKTEVYLHVMKNVLKQGKQCLLLVPEIGLTPQTLQRFQSRFSVPIVVLHSNLNDTERHNAWMLARNKIAKIVIGTRSAIFTPLPDIGIIIIDEEHDNSFKQHDTFRYSARDLAVVRAQQNDVPILLGTATPSLESLHNALCGRWQHLQLSSRAGNASLPEYAIIDIRNKRMQAGVSSSLQDAISSHLADGNQVLLFINRRGYAPVLMCHGCGWVADCEHCDAHLTLHNSPRFLQCHHCGSAKRTIDKCPQCHAYQLASVGVGTEKIEEYLQNAFPDITVTRIDRDSTRRKGSLHAMLNDIHQGEPQILIGTQMLAKGHHFPNVTLVGILNADNGFFSGDFRAVEQMGQLITQVAGRAGRAEKPGVVYLQTHRPDNPSLLQLIHQGYAAFARSLLEERQTSGLPPYAHFALFRAESQNRTKAENLLRYIKEQIQKENNDTVYMMGPISSNMEKRAGYFRIQLLLHTFNRKVLQQILSQIMPTLDNHKLTQGIRWSLDVDPLEVF